MSEIKIGCVPPNSHWVSQENGMTACRCAFDEIDSLRRQLAEKDEALRFVCDRTQAMPSGSDGNLMFHICQDALSLPAGENPYCECPKKPGGILEGEFRGKQFFHSECGKEVIARAESEEGK